MLTPALPHPSTYAPPAPSAAPAEPRGPRPAEPPAADLTHSLAADALRALDRAHTTMGADGGAAHVAPAMDALVGALGALRAALPSDQWLATARALREHPARAFIHEEPLTRRAFEKPRGYAGDAAMMDLIYGVDGSGPAAPAGAGAHLYDWIVAKPAPRSVQARRDLLAGVIDDVATTRPGARVLSVACGHLREAQRSAAVRGGALSELVALDRDRESLALVEREQRASGVTPVCASVRALLAGRAGLGAFDLVYSAGLYDYLADPVAEALTAALFALLRPGGRLVVGNFAPDLPDVGYMESFMDWHLLYRDEGAVRRLAARIPESRIASVQVYRDAPGNVVYLDLIRR